MNHNSTTLAVWLVLAGTFICCCCGGLGGNLGDLPLLSGDIEEMVQDATGVNLKEIIPTPTPTPGPGTEDQAVEAPAGPAGETPETEAPPAGEDVSQEAEELLGALQEHMEEGGDTPFTFGCDNPSIPVPPDMTGCVSVAGFTTYSTAETPDAINKMYDDYFMGQGWEHFPQAIQEEVLNAWRKEGVQGYAILGVTPGAGEDGKNLVNLAVITAEE